MDTALMAAAVASSRDIAQLPLAGSGGASPTDGSIFVGVGYLGSATIPNGRYVDGTLVGGLSGLTRLPNGTYVAISDDKAAERADTLSIDLGDGRLDQNDVTVTGVIRLTDGGGRPFPPSDPEAIVSMADGSFYISSEGSNQPPFIKRFDAGGTEVATLRLPKALTGGYEYNRGIESLGLTPDGQHLFTGTEHPLKQDLATRFSGGLPSRIFEFDTSTGQVAQEFVYTIDDFGADGRIDDNGLVELIALDDTHLLALERIFVSGRGNSIRLYAVDRTGATDVAGLNSLSEAGEALIPLKKTLLANLGFLPDFLAGTSAFVDTRSPDNIEGMTLGPRLEDGRQSILLVSDNNFRSDARQITNVVALALEPGDNHAPTLAGLDGTPRYVRGGPAVVLDANATVADPELDRANAGHGDYRGATLTIARSGGAAAGDHFGSTGPADTLTEGSTLVHDGTAVGTVAVNAGGVLKLAFNGHATSAAVDHVMQSITYANPAVEPGTIVALDYTFNDGITDSVGSHQVHVSTAFEAMHPGFSVASVDDWFDSAWGGGFDASFDYVVQASDLRGDAAFAWTIAPTYHGAGTLANAWVEGHAGPVATARDADGDLVLTTQGEAYRPALKAGDVIHYAVQVTGAGFHRDDFASAFLDLDAPQSGGASARIEAQHTNDWGGGLNQSVIIHNTGTGTIEHWYALLDVADGIDVSVTGVWGATVTRTASGDLAFEAADWNGTIGAGGTADFGFNATYGGAAHLSFQDSDFTFHMPANPHQDHMLFI